MNSLVLLAKYMKTKYFLTDFEMGLIFGTSHDNIRTMRNRLIKKGHEFYYKTVQMDNGKVCKEYKYKGRGFDGLINRDDKKPSCTFGEMYDLYDRMRDGTVVKSLLKQILNINQNEYWTCSFMCKMLNLTPRQFRSAKSSLTKHYGAVFHSIGEGETKKFRLTEITGISSDKPKQETVYNPSLLNKVFA